VKRQILFDLTCRRPFCAKHEVNVIEYVLSNILLSETRRTSSEHVFLREQNCSRRKQKKKNNTFFVSLGIPKRIEMIIVQNRNQYRVYIGTNIVHGHAFVGTRFQQEIGRFPARRVGVGVTKINDRWEGFRIRTRADRPFVWPRGRT